MTVVNAPATLSDKQVRATLGLSPGDKKGLAIAVIDDYIYEKGSDGVWYRLDK